MALRTKFNELRPLLFSTHFLGPLANWGLVGASVYDAVSKGPENISPTMTATLMCYSTVFCRFALRVKPTNYLLFACHSFNVAAQAYQLSRWTSWHSKQTDMVKQLPMGPERDAAAAKLGPGLPWDTMGMALAAAAIVTLAAQKGVKPAFLNYTPAAGSLGEKAKGFVLHPAGLLTIHGIAPLFKWLLSIQSFRELDRPLEQISLPQQVALASTGFIWSRYACVITPKNMSLFLVNFVLGCISSLHIARKVKAEYFADDKAVSPQDLAI